MIPKREQERRQPGNSVVNVIDVVPHTSRFSTDFQVRKREPLKHRQSEIHGCSGLAWNEATVGDFRIQHYCISFSFPMLLVL